MGLPVAAVMAIKYGAPIAAGLLGKLFGGKKDPAQSAMTNAVAARTQAETRIIEMRESWLRQLMGERSDFERAILGDDGKPLVLKLPGVGGVSGEEWSDLLDQFVGNTDFGGKRSKDFAMQLLGQMTPGGNTAGAAAGLASGMEAQRQSNIQGTTGMAQDMIGDLTGILVDKFGGGGAGAPSALEQNVGQYGGGGLADLSFLGGGAPVPGGYGPAPTGPSVMGVPVEPWNMDPNDPGRFYGINPNNGAT